jgi:hypothetical protein
LGVQVSGLNERKAIKVVLYYDDGSIVTLEGEEFEVWMSTLNSAMMLLYTHGGAPHQYVKLWQKIMEHLKTSKTYP